MPELTQNMIETVNELSQESNMSGLRIFRHEVEDDVVLAATLVDGPLDGDEIVEDGGAFVYLDAPAAATLADKVLDAHIEDGHMRLSVLDRS